MRKKISKGVILEDGVLKIRTGEKPIKGYYFDKKKRE
jgi:hypothetical protein